MVWEFFQSGQIRKNREQLERVTRELADMTTFCGDLAKRVVELEQRIGRLESNVEQALPLLEQLAQGDVYDHRPENGANSNSDTASDSPLSEEGEEPDEEI